MTIRLDTMIILNSSLTFLSDSAVAPFLLSYLKMSKETILALCKPFICHLTSALTIVYVLKDPTAVDVGGLYK